MTSTAIIIFREILEIALILSLVAASTKGLPGRGKWIGYGIATGLSGSLLIAIFSRSISSAAEGMGQEFFNALILFAAAAMIGWTVLWMKKHGKELAGRIKKMGEGIRQEEVPFYSLSVIIALAIFREGAEIVLFINGMIATGQPASSIIMGSLVGAFGGTAIGIAMYYGLITLSSKYIFSVTSALLMFVSAGMAAMGAKYLVMAGWFDGLSMVAWDSSAILSENSWFGQIVHVLLGYADRPNYLQVVAYVGTLGVLISGMFWVTNRALYARRAISVFSITIIAVFLIIMSSHADALALMH
jgi:high-affinity iron transporter